MRHVLFSVIKQRRGCGLFSCEQVDISASAVQVDYFAISGGPTFFLANSRGEFKWVSVWSGGSVGLATSSCFLYDTLSMWKVFVKESTFRCWHSFWLFRVSCHIPKSSSWRFENYSLTFLLQHLDYTTHFLSTKISSDKLALICHIIDVFNVHKQWYPHVFQSLLVLWNMQGNLGEYWELGDRVNLGNLEYKCSSILMYLHDMYTKWHFTLK